MIQFLSYNLMLNSGKKFRALRDKLETRNRPNEEHTNVFCYDQSMKIGIHE
jgi:hypothetical protein